MLRHVKTQPRYKYHAPLYCYPSEMILNKKREERERKYIHKSLKITYNKKRKDVENTLAALRREFLGIMPNEK